MTGKQPSVTPRLLLDGPGGKVWAHEVRQLLVAIGTEGSLNRAAKAAGIPYRRAWQILHSAGEVAGGALTAASAGGSGGGGSVLNERGRQLLSKLDDAEDTVSLTVSGLTDVSEDYSLPPAPHLLVASSTEPADCGLLEALEQAFEQEHGLVVRHLAVGSGVAFSLLLSGRVDLALTHAPAIERRLLSVGRVGRLESVMSSHYVLALFSEHTGDISSGDLSCEALFARIAAQKVPFVSRDDRSGTHIKELELWKQTRVEPEPPWYIKSTTGGARAAIQAARARGAATLVDKLLVGSLHNLEIAGNMEIVEPACQEAEDTFSIALSKESRRSGADAALFADWLHTNRAQSIISSFGAAPV